MTVSIETLHVDGDVSVAVARFHPEGELGAPFNGVATLLFKGTDVYIVGMLSRDNLSIEDVMSLSKALELRGVKQAFYRHNITDPFKPFDLPSWRLD